VFKSFVDIRQWVQQSVLAMNDHYCPQCDGPTTLLGTLGNLEHYRCRDCGYDSSAPVQKKLPLFLIEFYTNNLLTLEGGWDINFAWVYAPDAKQAEVKLKSLQGPRFDCVIQIGEHAQIVPLAGEFRVNTPDANLFIIL
jgi:hypothetical protein